MRVLVTGGSRGIGRSIVEELSVDHDVAFGYRNSESNARDLVDELSQDDRTVVSVQGDVSDPADADALVEQSIEDLGGLDAVINNAGIVSPALVTDMSAEDWETVISTNLSGAFYISRSALPQLQPDGHIVFISSIGGTAGTVDASYAASKAGLHGLTRALAREYGDEGVQVNAIAPGPVETEMNAEIVSYLEGVDFRGHQGIDTHLPRYACDPDEIARAVRFVLQSTYLQGEVLNLNGGMHFR